MENKYVTHNRRKHSLKVHIVFVTKYRKKILKGDVSVVLKEAICESIIQKNGTILAMETDIDHIHFLITYDTTTCVSDLVKWTKQYSTYILWKTFPTLLKKYYWKKRAIWSDGYFACSIGEASTATIQRYIAQQG